MTPDQNISYRYERKYRINSLRFELVHQVLRQHPIGLRRLYPDRQVNNIYFDTPDFQAYHSNVNGAENRRKWRLRWYGQQLDYLETPVFEIKIKRGELGYKLSFPQDSIAWASLPDLFPQFPQPDIPLYPSLVNAYQRSYFGTTNGRFRMTIDREMIFAPYRPNRPQLHQLSDSAIILELKYDQEYAGQVTPVLKGIPFRQTKNSKYVIGMGILR